MPFPFLPPEERSVFPTEGQMHLPPDTENAFVLCVKIQRFNQSQADCQWSQNQSAKHHCQLIASGAEVTIHELAKVRREVHGK